MELKLIVRDEEIRCGYSTRVYLKNGKKYINPKKVKFETIGVVSVDNTGFVIGCQEGEATIFATYRNETVCVDLSVYSEKRPMYVGHRGGQPNTQEEVSVPNTKLAFELGAKRNTYGVETDLRISPDHVFYLHHDGTMTLTPMNFEEKELKKYGIEVDSDINAIPYETLKKLHPYWINGDRKDKTKICLLKDYIKVCKENNKKLVLELKYTNGVKADDLSYMDEIVEQIKKAEVYENTIFISFIREACEYLRVNYVDAEVQFLTGPNTTTDENIDWCCEYQASIDAYYGAITDEQIKKIHKNYMYVNVWTVNDQEKANELLARGVDIITSDKLEAK